MNLGGSNAQWNEAMNGRHSDQFPPGWNFVIVVLGLLLWAAVAIALAYFRNN